MKRYFAFVVVLLGSVLHCYANTLVTVSDVNYKDVPRRNAFVVQENNLPIRFIYESSKTEDRISALVKGDILYNATDKGDSYTFALAWSDRIEIDKKYLRELSLDQAEQLELSRPKYYAEIDGVRVYNNGYFEDGVAFRVKKDHTEIFRETSTDSEKITEIDLMKGDVILCVEFITDGWGAFFQDGMGRCNVQLKNIERMSSRELSRIFGPQSLITKFQDTGGQFGSDFGSSKSLSIFSSDNEADRKAPQFLLYLIIAISVVLIVMTFIRMAKGDRLWGRTSMVYGAMLAVAALLEVIYFYSCGIGRLSWFLGVDGERGTFFLITILVLGLHQLWALRNYLKDIEFNFDVPFPWRRMFGGLLISGILYVIFHDSGFLSREAIILGCLLAGQLPMAIGLFNKLGDSYQAEKNRGVIVLLCLLAIVGTLFVTALLFMAIYVLILIAMVFLGIAFGGGAEGSSEGSGTRDERSEQVSQRLSQEITTVYHREAGKMERRHNDFEAISNEIRSYYNNNVIDSFQNQNLINELEKDMDTCLHKDAYYEIDYYVTADKTPDDRIYYLKRIRSEYSEWAGSADSSLLAFIEDHIERENDLRNRRLDDDY